MGSARGRGWHSWIVSTDCMYVVGTASGEHLMGGAVARRSFERLCVESYKHSIRSLASTPVISTHPLQHASAFNTFYVLVK